MRRWIEHKTVESEDGAAETVVMFHFGRVVDEAEVDLEFIEFGERLQDDLAGRRACDPLACMRCRVGAPLSHRRHDPACSEYADCRADGPSGADGSG